MEQIDLSKIRSELKRLNETIKTQEEKRNEELCVSKLEDLCFSLKCAIIDLNLKFPDLTTFERYLSSLRGTDDILYVIDLLHQCWVYTHPDFFFNRNTKETLDTDATLDLMLSKYSGKRTYEDCHMDNEINKNNFTGLHLLYMKSFQNIQSSQKYAYQNYMDGLWNISNDIFRKKQIIIGKDFTLQCSIATDLRPAQIDAVFNVLVQNKKTNSDEETRNIFKAIFDTTINTAEGKILWLDKTKSHTPNYSSLYVLFKSLGVEMTALNKAIICSFFKVPGSNGEETAVRPCQLKSRTQKKEKDNITIQAEDASEKEQSLDDRVSGSRAPSKVSKEFEKQIKEAISKCFQKNDKEASMTTDKP